jgi:transcriptional regulator with XRE-family HTH domain
MWESATKNISQYVKRTMRQKRLRLRDIERKSGGRISSGYVSDIVRGAARNLTVEKLKALAAGLDVDVREVIEVTLDEGTPDLEEESGTEPLGAVLLLDLMQKVVVDPDLTSLLRMMLALSPEDRHALLETAREEMNRSSNAPKQSR